MEQEQRPQNITPAQDVFLAPKKPTGLIIATVVASVIALASIATTVVTLVKADKKSAEIAELSAKVEALQQNTTTEPTGNTTNNPTNTTLSLSEQLKEAYKNKTGKDYSFDNVTSAAIKNSAVSPYQTIEATVVIDLGGSYTSNMALFYRTSPDAEWQYFTNTTGVLSCSDYNTDDIRKAYVGEQCYDASTGTQSTVQL